MKKKNNSNKILINFGKSIMAMSSQKQKSLERIAYEAGISKSYIYNIVKGKANPSLLILCKIASALNIPFWELFKNNIAAPNLEAEK